MSKCRNRTIVTVMMRVHMVEDVASYFLSDPICWHD